MRISVLASSSRGNASVIAAGETVLMVDAGISARRLCGGLEVCGLSARGVQGIFITHEHSDHICGLGQYADRREVPIYCSRYLRDDMRAISPSSPLIYVEPGTTVQVGDIRVTPFAVNHDVRDPLGYVFEHEGVRLGYLTDTGHVTRRMEALLQGVNALYLESNYDERLLHNSGRPRLLINRIEGPFGHLSNTQACELVRRVAHPGLEHVILAHLSPECNTPEIAASAMQQTLDDLQLRTQLHLARQAERLPWVDLRPFILHN